MDGEDAAILLPPSLPPTEEGRVDNAWRVGKYVFRADFDSANLQCVKQGPTPQEFCLWTSKDCQDTEHERGTRSWFYFGVSGHTASDFLVLCIMNLNKQGRLFSQDYRPWIWNASMPEWQPLPNKVSYRREGDDFQLRFSIKMESTEETFFAFGIPHSYRDTQNLLDHVGRTMNDHFSSIPPECIVPDYPSLVAAAAAAANGALGSSSSRPGLRPNSAGGGGGAGSGGGGQGQGLPPNPYQRPGPLPGERQDAVPPSASRIYFKRQLLARSIEGRRVDLLTITDCYGASGEEELVPGAEALGEVEPVAKFPGKKVFFISARVHPGETPATHMFNGLLAFLLRTQDARAAALRRRFVFKLVPMVNPDGVYHGYYRTDTRGQNLNRYYIGQPNRELQPSVWAIKHQLMLYAHQGLLDFYIDLHAHANKKGVFLFGNAMEGEQALSSLMYARLVALNNPVFDFQACNYTEKNMSRSDKDGVSKEGAGRVALFRETGLTHLYTVEANYNTARILNVVAPATGDHGGRASPPSGKRFPPRFMAPVLHGVGRAFAIAALDLAQANPWTRLPNSEHRSLEGVRAWALTCVRAGADARAQHLPPMSESCLDSLKELPSGARVPLSSSSSMRGGLGAGGGGSSGSLNASYPISDLGSVTPLKRQLSSLNRQPSLGLRSHPNLNSPSFMDSSPSSSTASLGTLGTPGASYSGRERSTPTALNHSVSFKEPPSRETSSSVREPPSREALGKETYSTYQQQGPGLFRGSERNSPAGPASGPGSRDRFSNGRASPGLPGSSREGSARRMSGTSGTVGGAGPAGTPQSRRFLPNIPNHEAGQGVAPGSAGQPGSGNASSSGGGGGGAGGQGPGPAQPASEKPEKGLSSFVAFKRELDQERERERERMERDRERDRELLRASSLPTRPAASSGTPTAATVARIANNLSRGPSGIPKPPGLHSAQADLQVRVSSPAGEVLGPGRRLQHSGSELGQSGPGTASEDERRSRDTSTVPLVLQLSAPEAAPVGAAQEDPSAAAALSVLNASAGWQQQPVRLGTPSPHAPPSPRAKFVSGKSEVLSSIEPPSNLKVVGRLPAFKKSLRNSIA